MRVVASDYDNTIADTTEDSPDGMNVPVAYQESIRHLFGTNAFAFYDEHGGLRNRAPREVVLELYEEFGPRVFDQAFGLGIPSEVHSVLGERELVFTDGGIKVATELLVMEKLRLLLPHVGTRFEDGEIWPRPMPSFAEYWKRVSGDPEHVTMVLSSGHDAFITKWFGLLDLPMPDMMVTDDTLRRLPKPTAKPDSLVFDLGMFMLRAQFEDIDGAVYFGDDSDKDGMMARNACVPFCHFDLSGESEECISFSDWNNAPWPYGILVNT